LKDLPELRQDALEIFAAALRAVDADAATRRAVSLDGSILTTVASSHELDIEAAGLYVIAIGKAAPAMAAAVAGILDKRIGRGIISGPALSERQSEIANLFAPDRWRFFAGGHPLPNQESLNAAQAGFDLLRRADQERAPVLFLISGGGSAMFEWPRNELISLADLRHANQLLISCGASIAEVNSVRRTFSAAKGGALARLAPRSPQITFIISDTNAGDEASVASGPTILPPSNAPDPKQVVARHDELARLPTSILNNIQSSPRYRESEDIAAASRLHFVLLDNHTALNAAAETARQLGFQPEIAEEIIESQIAEGTTLLLERLQALRTRTSNNQPVCLISGGEFRCPVRGNGLGGRNSETVLRWAIEIDRQSSKGNIGNQVGLSAGTDGQDGNSPAAGALADQNTIPRAGAAGLDPGRFLEDSNSFSFFEKLGDMIDTGATGTNVRDVRILLAG
jgi:glycerate 2-kinase